MSSVSMSDSTVSKEEAGVEYFDSDSNYLERLMEHLNMNKEDGDFHFVFNDKTILSEDRVPVHKFILSAASEVFQSNFNGKWNGKTEVMISDVEIEAFKEFIQFIYLGKLKLSTNNVADVISLSNKYKIDECFDLCRKFLKSKLDYENILWGFEIAIKYNDEKLKNYCEMIIGSNASVIFSTDAFKTCNQNILAHILEIKFKCPMVDVFEACMNWVKSVSGQEKLNKASIDKYLGDLFYKIRFGSMTLKEVGVLIKKYRDIFSVDQYRKIIHLDHIGDGVELEKQITWDENIEVFGERIPLRLMPRSSKPLLYPMKKIETTTFSSDTPLVLTGFERSDIFIQEEQQKENFYDEMTTNITIIEINPTNLNEKIVMESKEIKFIYQISRGEQDCNKIVLPQLIFIKPKFMYKIIMKQTPPENAHVSAYGLRVMNLFKKNGTENIMKNIGEINFHGKTVHKVFEREYSAEYIKLLRFIQL